MVHLEETRAFKEIVAIGFEKGYKKGLETGKCQSQLITLQEMCGEGTITQELMKRCRTTLEEKLKGLLDALETPASRSNR